MFYVNESVCTGCGACVEACPTGAIRLHSDHAVIRQDLCRHCAACARECPNGAVVESGEPVTDKASASLRSGADPPLSLGGQPLASPQPLMPAWTGWLTTVAPLALDLMAGFAGRGGRGRRGRAAGIHRGRGRGGCRGRRA